MPLHTEAERKKRKKEIKDLFRRIAPGQLAKDLLGKAQRKINKATKK